jgi:heme A synthase
VLQVVIAASMVELHLPAPLQSLHQAVGTLVWVMAMTAAALAGRAQPVPMAARVQATPALVPTP